eukprot:CAMPEP_0117681434 /NCGR_PEP_ID=MMETSP0804-20121206/18981_1 /TAXON_ID=1074897 /ORGANISM="Tetraselmis astigmatica, Strain CCMP880" /LENGTH=162 /DNA_ID=CAMNT_0005491193 /DNA_START=234 /DNA_END=722 /DNA_ORIENTATION=+
MPHYMITRPVPADKELSRNMVEALKAEGVPVACGLNATACSFYSSQGRVDSHFMDCNRSLLSGLTSSSPKAISLEMETFQLLDLARCSRGSIKCSAACIAVACRTTNNFMDLALLPEIEQAAGKAVLEALVACGVQNDSSTECPVEGVSYVWGPSPREGSPR